MPSILEKAIQVRNVRRLQPVSRDEFDAAMAVISGKITDSQLAVAIGKKRQSMNHWIVTRLAGGYRQGWLEAKDA